MEISIRLFNDACAPGKLGEALVSLSKLQNMAMRFSNVDQYIDSFPSPARERLQLLRDTVKQLVPEGEEVISYNIPAFKWKGMLVWYAAFKNHIGFYPRGSAIEAFGKELSKYTHAKGSVQFPLEEPLPLALIRKIVRFRKKENEAAVGAKKKAVGG